MSEMILCPVCETVNAPNATHCEVCGERLTPAAPGEELSPEENVSGMIAAAAQDEGEGHEMAMPDLPASDAEDDGPARSFGFAPVADDEEGDEAGMDAPSVVEGPQFLYSSLDGKAYAAGTPEYEEGFGPMGEELVAEPPAEVSEGEADGGTVAGDESEPAEGPAEVEPADEDPSEAQAGFSHDEHEVHVAPAPSAGASAAFAAAFPVRTKERPATQPLPQPGVHAEPATLTLYVNRQPVHTHFIETDETLVGRRDPVADSYPEMDLTDWDETSHVSRKHVYIYRQNRNYQLYVVSNSGTQLNAELLNLGDRRALKGGDVIVLAGKFAMKFEVPAE